MAFRIVTARLVVDRTIVLIISDFRLRLGTVFLDFRNPGKTKRRRKRKEEEEKIFQSFLSKATKCKNLDPRTALCRVAIKNSAHSMPSGTSGKE